MGLLLTIITAGTFLVLWLPYMMLVLPFRRAQRLSAIRESTHHASQVPVGNSFAHG
jgi:hypothetical protein